MSSLIKISKAILPESVLRYVRTRHRDFVFWRAITKLSRDPRGVIATPGKVISDLIYGWDNEGWSASDEYLLSCLQFALASHGPILECGSGLTTILLGIIAQKTGNIVWTLEHNQVWYERVNKYIKKFKIHSVRLCFSPLKDFGDFCWYSVPLDLIPDKFSMVVCDGPPGRTRGGRYGLLPIMKQRLKPGATILLDDAEREQEKAIAIRWADELGTTYRTLGFKKPFIQITIPTFFEGNSPTRWAHSGLVMWHLQDGYGYRSSSQYTKKT